MCGFVGVISKNTIHASTIKKMNDAIIHRGPDDEGFLFGSRCDVDVDIPKYSILDSDVSIAFGHRRLAIVDLSSMGHQPMEYKDRYWIVYNGEIYNHIELKEELCSLGYEFISHTDTEVILASYDAWGSGCLNKFNGMWSFAIYDNKKKRLFISRDRFGVKPLYYYRDDHNFIFASEIKAILEHGNVQKIPNMKYCKNYLEEGPQEHLKETAFSNIYRFDNSCFLDVSVDDVFLPFEEQKFWLLNPSLSNEKYDEQKALEYANEYYRLLDDAVRVRLRADVKIGSALSGGLDSSSIVYLVNKQLRDGGQKENQETFSTVYKTSGTSYCDESSFIEEVTNILNVNSNHIEPNVEDIINEHKKFTYYLDTPAANTLMSSWHTYMLINRCGVKVTLDGQGADEQLAGYLSYLLFYFSNLELKDIFGQAKLFWNIDGSKKWLIVGIILNIIRLLIGKNLTYRILMFFGIKTYPFENLNVRLGKDLECVLGTLFHYADRGSMAFSVESRMPFMDYRLVEFLASVPASYKIHSGWTKYIARKAFDNILPDAICWRKDKMGWPIPEKFWFSGQLRGYLVANVQKSIIIEEINKKIPKNIEKIIEKNFGFAMRCYCLSVWESVFFNSSVEKGD